MPLNDIEDIPNACIPEMCISGLTKQRSVHQDLGRLCQYHGDDIVSGVELDGPTAESRSSLDDVGRMYMDVQEHRY